MSRVRSLVAFLRDFIIGDDPLMFGVVCVGLTATGGIEGLGVPAWWLLPVSVLLALAASVWRARSPT